MDNHHREDGADQSQKEHTPGIFSSFRKLLGSILEGENGTRITTVGGVVLLVAIVVIAMRAFYLNSQNIPGNLAVFAEEPAEGDQVEGQTGASGGGFGNAQFCC